ncbi:unconventional myosin-Ia-like [Choristoneura fumiferana]|uniref:unconventional myosin-Ia-like n=1 Tax=Choristoneura fumiferana TaxID=7141 RepID=UPI003D158A58
MPSSSVSDAGAGAGRHAAGTVRSGAAPAWRRAGRARERERGGAGAGAGEAGQCDAVLLAPLTEDSFLHNLHVRYKRDIIYTYVGNALVSVNPCRALPQYSLELVRAYLARPPYQLPPHLYAITAAAYRWVRDRGESQCIVITGESGAGKTEAARVCLQCAVVAAAAAAAGRRAPRWPPPARCSRPSATPPPRATTTPADSSGKLLDIEFDFKGEPVGGHISHCHTRYETERASGALEGERNFHVLYQLLAGPSRTCSVSVPPGCRPGPSQLPAPRARRTLMRPALVAERLKLQRSWEHYAVLRGAGDGEGGGGAVPPAAPPPPCSPRRTPPPPPPPPPGPRAAQADRDHFQFTKAAMARLGLSASECGGVLRLLAFLLKLGNVQFEPTTTIDGALATRLHHEYELREACALVGVEAGALAAALGAPPLDDAEGERGRFASLVRELQTFYNICISSSRDRVSSRVTSCNASKRRDAAVTSRGVAEGSPGSEESASVEGSACGAACGGCAACAGAAWARARRDVLLQALYARLFAWLLARVNEAIKPAEAGARQSLGILDVYGFESLAHNGLERLLINYAAERLQAHVTHATLRREQDEYAREQLAWLPLPYRDHDAAADLLDAGPDSVLGCLREAGARGGGDAGLVQRLQRRRHPLLLVLPPDHFQVAHFAGPVVYSARGMPDKNRDAVCRRCCGVLSAAREPLLAALFPAPPPHAAPAARGECHRPPPVPATRSPRRPAALACRQRALVGALLRRLPGAPRLVRCLRADPALRPHRFDAALLRHQIRTQGIMDMALLRRAGWCESWCARSVVARYGVLAPARAAPPADPVRAARALLRPLPIPSAEFAYGRTKVFIRSPRTVWELEALRAARVEQLVRAAQRAWRRHRARRRTAAARVIQRRAAAARVVWRAWSTRARRAYLLALWRRLPARHRSPLCAAWPAPPQPALLGRTDALLRRLHHRWRCGVFRAAFDQTARNRMREKVTASVLFRSRKALYGASVAHPFVGDYVRLRASGAWRRGAVGAAGAQDRYVVFADVVGKVARSSGRVARCLAVLSTAALLLLDARSLRVRRRVPAQAVYRLSLSPHADDLLVVHVRCAAQLDSDGEELSQCSSRDAPLAPGCLFAGEGAWRRRGDVVLRTCHVLELATKLFLVVQNAVGLPPHVNISSEFEANFGQQIVTISFHVLGGSGAAEGPARLVRRGSRMDVLL